jgi:hypothetical protein
MRSPTSISEQPYISTGHLPEPELVQRLGRVLSLTSAMPLC